MSRDHTPRYFIETFGCQMNVNDSEKVEGLLRAEGARAARTASDADVVFVNTCAVREKASQKLYTALGRLKRMKAERPGLVIGVGGCVAQLHGGEILKRAPWVDVLVGTHNVARVPELVRRAREGESKLVALDRREDAFEVPASVVAHSSTVRAFVTAIEGCNHVCSFCVVPRTRGPEMCRRPEAIEEEVESLVARGYAEVMLLGQTVNAYRHGGVGFTDLLERLDGVEGLARLRFTTSHPEHVDEAMARAFRRLERLCPHLHLPAQSGSDRILEDMRRGYTRAAYLETLERLRQERPDLAISGDVIVGYPGETEADFEATLELVEQAGYDGLFVFLYSPRPGTLAARRPDDVADAEKRRRLQVLNDIQQRHQLARNSARVGTCEEVLVDTVEAEGRVAGRTPHFRIVHFEGGSDLLGRRVTVEVTGAGANALQGRRIAPNNSLTHTSAAPIFWT